MLTKFYEFVQNRVGGYHVKDADKGLGPRVWIEAVSAAEANRIALNKGIYFDGRSTGADCQCCLTDRWVREPEGFGGTRPVVFAPDFEDHPEIYIHRLDGSLQVLDEYDCEHSDFVLYFPE